jgi:flagellar P-ring protein precursor FlgI
MITNLQQDPAGFSYVLTTPDYKTAAHAAEALNAHFGGGTAHAIDAETIRVNLPARFQSDTVGFLALAGDLKLDADQTAKIVINERTGTIVMGGDITLAPVAIAHGNLSITIATTNTVVPGGAFSNAASRNQQNTSVNATESGKKLIYITGAATLNQVVRALNTIGVSPRDLISIVQTLRESGSLQAEIDII